MVRIYIASDFNKKAEEAKVLGEKLQRQGHSILSDNALPAPETFKDHMEEVSWYASAQLEQMGKCDVLIILPAEKSSSSVIELGVTVGASLICAEKSGLPIKKIVILVPNDDHVLSFSRHNITMVLSEEALLRELGQRDP